MNEYKYILCGDLEKYNGWEIVKLFDEVRDGYNRMAIIKKDITPIQVEPFLSKATNQELIDELKKRMNKGDEE